MAKPKITWGHGFLTDCNDATGWTEGVSGMNADQASLTVEEDDIFKIQGVCDDAGNEYCYYNKDLSSLGLSTDLYTKFLVRYKTSKSSLGLGAKITVYFTSGSQDILPLQFSTDWKVVTGNLTAGKTIATLSLIADDDPNTTESNGTHQVYFDFIMFCKNFWEIPTIEQGGVKLSIPKKVGIIEIPGRDGDILQQLGMKSAEIILTGTIETSTTNWGTPLLEYLYYIVASQEPFQWFESDMIKCKVVVDPAGLELEQDSESGALRKWQIKLLQYSRSSLGLATHGGKQWFGF